MQDRSRSIEEREREIDTLDMMMCATCVFEFHVCLNPFNGTLNFALDEVGEVWNSFESVEDNRRP
jgi:hypothetical protein